MYHNCQANGLFQFTPLREGRHRWLACSSGRLVFQFTPLREGRHDLVTRMYAYGKISIHAPPRGATRIFRSFRRSCPFQFTPLREGRLFQVFCIPTEEIFQFTPLREGRRGNWVRKIKTIDISIHAPPRGATRCSRRSSCDRGLFQFTPLREGRRFERSADGQREAISIHAPPRGATVQAGEEKQ